MTILVTGCAGFIGFHYSLAVLKNNKKVIGIDNLNNYYDIKLKKDRLNKLKKFANFTFYKANLQNKTKLYEIFDKNKFNIVVHLAAQAGVRYSIDNTKEYLESNLVGFHNIIELSKSFKIKHFIFASTSSVYGNNKNIPFKETDDITKPESFYAATKISNEVISRTYSSIHKMRITGLRFFTVYGPYGRPDMALFKFTKNILNNKKIEVYNHGHHVRDFTYVTDIAISIKKLLKKIPKKNEKFNIDKKISFNSKAKIRVLNIGNGDPKELKDYISKIEKHTKKKAKINFLPFQIGDALKTYANINKLKKLIKFKPKVKINEGIKKFVEWYKDFSKKK